MARLVVSVELIQRAMAVEIDEADVEPVQRHSEKELQQVRKSARQGMNYLSTGT